VGPDLLHTRSGPSLSRIGRASQNRTWTKLLRGYAAWLKSWQYGCKLSARTGIAPLVTHGRSAQSLSRSSKESLHTAAALLLAGEKSRHDLPPDMSEYVHKEVA